MDLSAIGFDADIKNWFGGLEEPGARPARVTRVDRGGAVLITAAGSAQVRTQETVATGDWVALSADGERIVAVAPRRTAMSRADPSGAGEQILAANIDSVFVVAGLDRPVRPGRLERGFVVAWQAGAEPHLVLTKADLVADPDRALAEAAAMAPGVEAHLTSTVTGLGLEGLVAHLDGRRTAALLGESGAGKSTLVNALAGHDVMAIADVRAFDAKGRHTTTARYLVPMPGGGVLVDTPGLRQLALWTGDAGLAATFADVEELAATCRFADCAHRTEPGCAIRAAIAAGTFPERRLESYEKLQRELEHAEGRRSEHERRVEDRKFGKFYKAVMAEKRGFKRGRGPR